MTDTVTFDRWAGNVAHVTEATADDGRFLSLYVGPLPACPWNRWCWTVDTQVGAGDNELRPIAIGIEYARETAQAVAEEAARKWLAASLRPEAVA
jgi:hypothetical protein